MIPILLVLIAVIGQVSILRALNRRAAVVAAAPSLLLVLVGVAAVLRPTPVVPVTDPALIVLSANVTQQGSFLLMVAGSASLLGTLVLVAFREAGGATHGAVVQGLDDRSLQRVTARLVQSRLAPVLAFGFALVVTYALANGPTGIWSRSVYIRTPIFPALAAVAGAGLPLAFVIGRIAGLSGARFLRLAGVLLTWSTVAMIFASGSRTIAMVPLLAAVARLAARGSISRVRVVALGAVGVAGYGVALTSRASSAGHGIKPYALRVAADPIASVVDGLSTAADNLLFSAPLAAYVAEAGRFSASELLVSVNPAPGFLVGWPELAGSLRVHFAIPYSGIGELASLGVVPLTVFMFAVGAIVGAAAMARSKTSSLTLQTGLALIPTYAFLLLLQYNLRSSARVFYALLAIVFVAGILRRRQGARVLSSA